MSGAKRQGPTHGYASNYDYEMPGPQVKCGHCGQFIQGSVADHLEICLVKSTPTVELVERGDGK
jgi:hypothetical protein